MESLFLLAFGEEKSLAAPAMTGSDVFFNKLLGMQLQHLIVEFVRGRRRLRCAVEVSDVLPGFLDDPGAVFVTGPLMPGDYSARFERLDFVERGNPFTPLLRIRGFREHKMDAV